MSDLLNFLSGMGGGYIKGADLMSKRKQAIETAKLNNAIRQNTLNQQAETNDIGTYQKLVEGYDRSVKEAGDGISDAITPGDQAAIAKNYAPIVKSKFEALNHFSKTSKFIQARGFQSPALPRWVDDPDNYSGFASGGMNMKPADWAGWADNLGKFQLPQETVLNSYVSQLAGMTGGNFNPKQIDTLMMQYPLHAKHIGLLPEVRKRLLAMAPVQSLSDAPSSTLAPATSAAPATALTAMGNQSPAPLNSFKLPPMELIGGGQFDPSTPRTMPPVDQDFGLRNNFGLPVKQTFDTLSFADRLKAIGRPNTNQSNVQSTEVASQNTGMGQPPTGMGQPPTGRGLQNNSSNYNLEGTGVGAMTGEYNNLGGYTVPAKPPAKPVRKTQDELEADAIRGFTTSAEAAAASSRKFVKGTLNPDKLDTRAEPVLSLIQQGREEFNKMPQVQFKTERDFKIDDEGFPRTLPDSMKLAEAHNKLQTDIQGAWSARQTAIKGLVEMADKGVRLPGDLKKTDLDIMDKAIDVAIKDMTTTATVKKSLAEAHTAVVTAVWTAAKIKADIDNGTSNAASAATNARVNEARVALEAATKPIEELSEIRQNKVNGIKAELSSYTNENTNNDIAVGTSTRAIASYQVSDPAVKDAVNKWADHINTYGINAVLKVEDKEKEDQLWSAIPSNADFNLLGRHRTNLKEKARLREAVAGARNRLTESTGELDKLIQVLDKVQKSGSDLRERQQIQRAVTIKNLKSDAVAAAAAKKKSQQKK